MCVGGEVLLLLALADSGAEDNLLDERLAAQVGCKLQSLGKPIKATALNCKILTEVTHCTTPIKMVLSGNHHEEISFHIIHAPHSSLFLSHPWLKLHNPHIGLLAKLWFGAPTVTLSASTLLFHQRVELPVHSLTTDPQTFPVYLLLIMTSGKYSECALSLPPH